MATLNVRLGEVDARLVRELKRRGISISNLVRGALRSEAERTSARGALDVDALSAEMINRYPTPESAGSRRVNAADRRQVQKAITEKLRKRRR